jgi:hypothetical protein
MTDQHDLDRDRTLAERLAAAEGRVPVTGAAPDLEPQRAPGVPRWAMAAAAAAGLVVVAGAALLSQVLPPPVAEGSPSPTAASSALVSPEATAAVPSATPSPTPIPTDTGIPTIVWEPTEPAAAEIRDLEWLGGRFVAVGLQDGRAAAWTMAPAGPWQAASPIDPPYVQFDPSTDEEGQEFWMSTVVDLDGELIGMGWQRIGCCDAGRAATWASADGVTWTYLDLQGTPYGEAYHFPADAAVSSTGEIVLVSGVDLGGASTIWISPDGRTWEEHAPDLGEFTRIQHIAAGEGRLLALGDAPGGFARVGKAWVSTDGRSWSEVEHGLPIGADYLTAIAYDARSDLFVVGGSGPGGLQVWFTADGSQWSPAQLLANGEGTLTGISARNGIVMATGTLGPYEASRAFAWQISMGDEVAPRERLLVDGVPAGEFRVAVGNAVALVHGWIVEADGALPVGRAWYGVLAVP